MHKKSLSRIRWIARITGTLFFLFITPFYVGYGFPLPNASMSFLENLWLVILPIFLVGLALGWKWEKVAGYMITVPIVIGFLSALIAWEDPSVIMALPLIPGVLYLVYGYKK